MSVNRIGQGYYGNYYGTGSISSLYKLQMQQAIQRTNSSSALNRSNVTRYMDSSSTNFLKSYNSSMASLMSDAGALRTGNASGLWNKTAVSSSDKSVLEVKQNYRMSTQDTYQVDVKQLAAKQKNSSNGIAENALAQKDAVFSISNEKGTFSFRLEAQDKKGNFKTNGQMLKEMAEVVNQSDIGVKASASAKDGISQITFISESTGKKNVFRMEGEFAEANGLGKASTEAQDAVYTVSKNGRQEQTYTSAENTVTLDYGRMSATFGSTGEATVKAGVDIDGVVSATGNLVDSYNSTISMLQKNVDRGYGVERQLNQMRQSSLSDKSLELLGITKDSNGKMYLDETKLRNSLETNPALTKELLGGSFSLAQSMFDDGRQGLSQSGSSLLQNDVETAYNNSYSNPFQLMGLYSRSGAYTMTNFYTVGNFINMLL